ncbi:unnamed protein product [Durusdinium trenchii]|uniref:Uncharacterized protein n=1 Tax=Durusdinium trenchii TaxID=1381693 RepID=A0ABP0Q9I3_9DINO
MDSVDVNAWATRNQCDHLYHTPYFIGHVASSATDCTEACPMTTYPDNFQVCHACTVAGCQSCSKEGCEECILPATRILLQPDDFFGGHSESQCFSIFIFLHLAFVLFCLTSSVLILLRFLCLSCGSAKSPGALEHCLAHRRRAKVRNYHVPGNVLYSFSTNVQRENVSGLGLALYFRHVAFQGLLSFFLIALSAAGHFLPELTHESAFLPRLIPPDKLGLAQDLHALALYVFCFVATVRWLFTQGRAARAEYEEVPHLADYALFAEGFPKSARTPHEVKAFFESILGFEIEGVSIAYDVSEELDFIEDRTHKAVEQADAHLGVYPAELSDLRESFGESQDGYVLDGLVSCGEAVVVFSREEDREFCLRRFAEIRRQVQSDVTEEADTDEESQALLGKSRPSRGSKGAKGRSKSSLSSAMLFRGKFPITVSEAPDPCDIIWENFQVQGGLKMSRVVLTLLSGLLFVLVLAAVMFAPSVLSAMSYTDIEAPSLAQIRLKWLEQLSMASLTALGNRVLAVSMRSAAEASGFVQKANEDSVFVLCSYLMVVANSVAPLLVAQLVAMNEDLQVTPQLATEWIFYQLTVSILITEILYVLYPAWTYWSGYFFVRQSKYITVREGQPALTSAEFPVAQRYVDTLLTVTMVFVMLVVDHQSIFTIGGEILMFLYGIYMYLIDKYFFLRVNRQTYYTSSLLDLTVHYLWAIPMCLLVLLPVRQLDSYFHQAWIKSCVVVGVVVLYLVMVRICQACNQPRRELTDVPYVEVASILPCNYFNTNHAHVLRTLHFPSIVIPPVYPHLPGKEYLHGGQFADYDDSVRLRETLLLLAKGPFKGLDDFGNPQD